MKIKLTRKEKNILADVLNHGIGEIRLNNGDVEIISKEILKKFRFKLDDCGYIHLKDKYKKWR